MWLFPQIRPCTALVSARPSASSATQAGGTAGASNHRLGRAKVWRQDPARDALLQCRDHDPSAWAYPRAELTHRNHHAGQVRLNSRGAGITPVGSDEWVQCDT